MEQARPRHLAEPPEVYADKSFAEQEKARLKTEIDQRVDQFLSAFDSDYRRSIQERELKKTKDA